MARNEFGCICDICGKYDKNKNIFYHLTLPTYQSDFNNSVQKLDYCSECYEDLKAILQIHYTKKAINK